MVKPLVMGIVVDNDRAAGLSRGQSRYRR